MVIVRLLSYFLHFFPKGIFSLTTFNLSIADRINFSIILKCKSAYSICFYLLWSSPFKNVQHTENKVLDTEYCAQSLFYMLNLTLRHHHCPFLHKSLDPFLPIHSNSQKICTVSSFENSIFEISLMKDLHQLTYAISPNPQCQMQPHVKKEVSGLFFYCTNYTCFVHHVYLP